MAPPNGEIKCLNDLHILPTQTTIASRRAAAQQWSTWFANRKSQVPSLASPSRRFSYRNCSGWNVIVDQKPMHGQRRQSPDFLYRVHQSLMNLDFSWWGPTDLFLLQNDSVCLRACWFHSTESNSEKHIWQKQIFITHPKLSPCFNDCVHSN